MAAYNIVLTRSQEVGLTHSYDFYADKIQFPTRESWLQYQINIHVSDPMYADYQRANSIAFDQSFATVPELEQPAAKNEIEDVIVAHGGTIIHPEPPPTPPGKVE